MLHQKHLLSILIVVLVFVHFVAACTPTADPTPAPTTQAFTRITENTLKANDPLPNVQGDVLLTVTGDIGKSNITTIDASTEGLVQFDRALLEQIGLIEYTTLDSQAEGREATFRGVLLSDILDVVQADDAATHLQATAADDYTVQIPISDVRSYPVMIALQVDGEQMSLDRFGPLRVIYPYHAHEFDASVVDARWIWSVVSFDVQTHTE